MTIHVQNSLFDYFTKTMEQVLRNAKRDGKLDLGIMDLGIGGQNVEIVSTRSFETRFLSDCAQVHLHKVRCQRGVAWKKALEIYYQFSGKHDGFYISKAARNNKPMPILAVRVSSRHRAGSEKKEKMYRVYRPNTGMQGKLEEHTKLKERYTKVAEPSDCHVHWEGLFAASETQCIHLYWFNHCGRRSDSRDPCEIGLRHKTYHVLSGSVLNVWARVESALSNRKPNQSTMQIVRLHTQGQRIIGSLIPNECVSDVVQSLSNQNEDFSIQN